MKNVEIEKLLASVENFNGDESVKALLGKFIKEDLIKASSCLIIYTHGKHVGIDGTRFSETELVWALEKAKNQVLNKGLSFD